MKNLVKRALGRALVGLLCLSGGLALAEEVPQELRDLKIMVLSAGDKRAVVRDGEGKLHLLAVGDLLPKAPATVTTIAPGRLVLRWETQGGPREVWLEPVAGAGPDRLRLLETTADEDWELSKPLIQVVGQPPVEVDGPDPKPSPETVPEGSKVPPKISFPEQLPSEATSEEVVEAAATATATSNATSNATDQETP